LREAWSLARRVTTCQVRIAAFLIEGRALLGARLEEFPAVPVCRFEERSLEQVRLLSEVRFPVVVRSPGEVGTTVVSR